MVDWDTENSDGVECPYCGYTQEDDNPQESGQYSCDECSKTFYVEVEYSATYYSTKPESELHKTFNSIEYWMNPAPHHSEHAEEILAGYRKKAEALEARIAKNKQKTVNQ